jgi:hypothetical protein
MEGRPRSRLKSSNSQLLHPFSEGSGPSRCLSHFKREQFEQLRMRKFTTTSRSLPFHFFSL